MRQRLGGVIAKRADAPYRAGRSRDWLKFKCEAGQEFVIGGFTDPRGTRTGFGALRLGYYDPGQKLVYAGKVGTGFTRRTLDRLHAVLAWLEQDRPPFDRGRLPRSGVHWVQPRLVAQVGFDRRGAAPPAVPGPAGRQGPHRCRPGDATGQHPVGRHRAPGPHDR